MQAFDARGAYLNGYRTHAIADALSAGGRVLDPRGWLAVSTGGADSALAVRLDAAGARRSALGPLPVPPPRFFDFGSIAVLAWPPP